MVKTAIQLFTLKSLDETPWELISRVGDTSFEGVEFYDSQFEDFDAQGIEKTVDALREHDLNVAGAHIRVERIEDEFDDVIAICSRLDCSTLVIPTYETDAFTTREGIENAANRLTVLASKLQEQDIELLYHNHTFEFGTIDDEVAFETFVNAAGNSLGFQPDTGLATHAGYDASQLLNTVGDRARTVHLTDTDPASQDHVHADPGTGVVNLEECAALAHNYNAEWLICENGRTTDPIATLEQGAESLARLQNKTKSSP
jgi:sugar phosphate isomerase/epimerase